MSARAPRRACLAPMLWALHAVVLGGAARAQPVLHEYVPPPGTRAPARAADGLPAEIRTDDQAVPQPEAGPPSPTERVLDGIPGHDRADRVSPDRTTTHDGVLNYRADFNPSVVPFKRMSALDTVGPGYVLRVGDRLLRSVPVVDHAPSPDRDRFWGTLVLETRPGRPVPIPSVAPDARILGYTATPRATLRFFRDSADNFWVQGERRGRLRLVFLTDAPKRYFTPQIPPGVTLADVPGPLRPGLPTEVRQAAQQVLRHIGVRRGARLRELLDRLVTYFRSFEAGALPRVTSDTYLDIALSQRGVCRHRSLAFVVTAQALGIPARYVQNEAHAFVEAFVPRMGWARIDLGGASSELRVSGAEQKAIHSPPPDPFPSPTRYAGGYSRLARGVRGLSPSQRAARARPRVALDRYDRSGAAAASAGASAGEAGAARAGRPGADAPGAPTDRPAPPEEITFREGEEGEEEEGTPEPAPPKRPTQISVYTSARSVFKGESITIWGRVAAGNAGASGLKIEIYLSGDGRIAESMLGTTVSGPDGRFSVALPVPRDLRAGDYKVYAATPGDERHEATISR